METDQMDLKLDQNREFALEARAAGMPLYRELAADARVAGMVLHGIDKTSVPANQPSMAKGRAWMI
ncbi:MAG: hypothetical protein ACR2OZ_00175 [Verrucomicrobiales bacterium]